MNKFKSTLKNIVVAGLDVDLGKGAAIVVCKGDKVRRQALLPSIRDDSPTVRIKYLVDKIINYLKCDHKPELRPLFVGLEAEAIQAKGAYRTSKSRLIGALTVRLYEEGFTLVEYAPMSVKAFACHGKAEKQEVMDAVNAIWGYSFNGQNGKPQDDLTDAFVISQLTLNQAGYLYLDRMYNYLSDKQEEIIDKACLNSKFVAVQDVFMRIHFNNG